MVSWLAGLLVRAAELHVGCRCRATHRHLLCLWTAPDEIRNLNLSRRIRITLSTRASEAWNTRHLTCKKFEKLSALSFRERVRKWTKFALLPITSFATAPVAGAAVFRTVRRSGGHTAAGSTVNCGLPTTPVSPPPLSSGCARTYATNI